MLDNFGLELAEPADFDPHRQLVGRVHDGVSKATAHLTYEANDFCDSARDYIAALRELLRVMHGRFYKPLGRGLELHPISSNSMNAPNQTTMQLTPKAFASRLATRQETRLRADS